MRRTLICLLILSQLAACTTAKLTGENRFEKLNQAQSQFPSFDTATFHTTTAGILDHATYQFQNNDTLLITTETVRRTTKTDGFFGKEEQFVVTPNTYVVNKQDIKEIDYQHVLAPVRWTGHIILVSAALPVEVLITIGLIPICMIYSCSK